MGYGVDYMMGTHKWHGAAPNDEQLLNLHLNQLPETLRRLLNMHDFVINLALSLTPLSSTLQSRHEKIYIYR